MPSAGIAGTDPDGSLASWTSRSYAKALHSGHGDLSLRDANGWHLPLDVARWCARADACDLALLRRCAGPVLDIGCGAGRLVEALARRGHRALGIDLCPSAVNSTMGRGGAALCRSVFASLPNEGHWGTALLLDGNIGIGGDPQRLLERIRALVHDQGFLLVETSAAEVDGRHRVRLHDGRRALCATFPWATVGCTALTRYGQAAGWTAVDRWSTAGGRHFAALRPAR
ncbi:methyltransferase domain-containing protein [Streptomyces sp. ISL-1]|uniref:class I SAM-dependent methyltransferase n=1 Tax=Streptomyces sp. ISL-1 TaxID=2817657 RepID=UPI0027E5721B|nr:methyltransferase domain-containing protein [Streptomyces sp. ISL-1]